MRKIGYDVEALMEFMGQEMIERAEGDRVVDMGKIGGVVLCLSEERMAKYYPGVKTEEGSILTVARESSQGWRMLTRETEQLSGRHYFIAGKSLCRSWLIFDGHGLEDVADDDKENCNVCQKRLKNLDRRLREFKLTMSDLE